MPLQHSKNKTKPILPDSMNRNRAHSRVVGRDAFHCVPVLSSSELIRDAVECVPTKTIFGARNLAGVAGHARRSNNKTTKERKVINV